MLKFVDIGANLTDTMYTGVYNGSKKHEQDVQYVLQRSWDNGLNKVIITAGNYEDSIKALDLSKTDGRLFTTVGCHPTRCLEFENDPNEYFQKLRKLIEDNKDKVVAIGECGLDYDRTQFCPIDIQKKFFKKQLLLSEEFSLPLFLHCRNAAKDLHEILSEHSNLKGVVHSFDGTVEEANWFIKLGYYIGLNGCSLKTPQNLETVAALPATSILLETDCPWCEIRPSHAGYNLVTEKNRSFPTTKKEKWRKDCAIKSRNEPMNIRQVFDVVATVKKEDPLKLNEIIYNNTIELFFDYK
ncbi:hypothetical protein RN001_000231 [Aquatica leii]|uniref:Deoxyribonuclease TATDN1 n=1 Tax=Aquatica leii TaxID=1421715 RepID=A0AAN7P9L0_9COLE|nr:hypothetical protein RN001_000231 [Aquatica leii]